MINLQTATAKYDRFISLLEKRQNPSISVFIEVVLPNKPDMNTQQTLEQLDKLKDWLDSFRPFSQAVVEEMKKYYDVNFTYHSNALEGNTLSKSETQLVLEKGITIGGKSVIEHLEVIGHKDAIDYIEELAKSETIIGEKEIKDIHSIILKGIIPEEAGRYRTIDVKASGTDHTYPPHYQLVDLMEDFISWMQSDEAKKLHPVILATEAHYRFVSIHPFRDGNGRTARLLMNLILIRLGYPIAVINNERRQEYIEALVFAQNNDNYSDQLIKIIGEATRASMIDYLQILSTAYESKGKGLPFYDEMIEFLSKEKS